jgi:hypothetical protein
MPRDLDIAREQARLLRPRALAEASRGVLTKWHKVLDKERGDVPIELAAVLVMVAGAGNDQDPWPLGEAAAERLRIDGTSSAHARLWAGLRTVNEVAAQLHAHYGAMWPTPDEGFWTAVVQAHGLGLARWVSALTTVIADQDPAEVEPADIIANWAAKAPAEDIVAVTKAQAALAAYRIGSARAKVEAARLLAGGVRPLRSYGFGRLLERPDIRRRVTAARVAGGTHIVSTVGMLAYHLGAKYAPRLFGS